MGDTGEIGQLGRQEGELYVQVEETTERARVAEEAAKSETAESTAGGDGYEHGDTGGRAEGSARCYADIVVRDPNSSSSKFDGKRSHRCTRRVSRLCFLQT